MSHWDDHLSISEVLVRYATGIDTRDWALFSSVFTHDVEADYGTTGVWHSAEAITETMIEIHEHLGHTMHQISNVSVELVPTTPDQPDLARARAYVNVILMNADGRTGTHATGVYADVLVRTQSGWRIKQRKFTLVLVDTVTNLDVPS